MIRFLGTGAAGRTGCQPGVDGAHREAEIQNGVRTRLAEVDRVPCPSPMLDVGVDCLCHSVRVSAAAPSGVVTFLFTDVEGSTRRWEADAAAMRAALMAHDDVLREAIET